MKNISIAFLGATGAVGTEAVKELIQVDGIIKISTFGRRPVPDLHDKRLRQHNIDIFNPSTYDGLLEGHDTAICTLGVGQPSKVSKEEFIKIDKTAVLDFATASKKVGVKHFELLASVGINPKSRTSYLRVKGELVEELKALDFERLSIFMPSMILTPENRYDWKQGLVLKIWPLLNPLLAGGLKKYRGVKVETLGVAMAKNIDLEKNGYEELTWEEFQVLAR